jgi:ribose 5-phosphate isomerase RpiB
MMRIGIVADHGGFELKAQLRADLSAAGAWSPDML